MAANDEDQQIKELVGRLTDNLPGVGAGVIAGIVANVHCGFEGRRVRGFVPLLVERMAS
ncbi:hypothetical protein KHQ06_19330 [Nocardia tengchongensis]|uniref:Uncharacterized protein n=1 Tax=Nocardia tengchongensis TaxID=2055889 RepID=A0ABX8CFF7_9NOCA|nr:hypothetical protein [Nocardia tengchongensis]QVI18703.1 hypothetical protein KHQ06_19330 [Nocardia tengchongensis]